MELDRIYNEDCMDGMKRIPDGSVDMILCDLPYGTTDAFFDKALPMQPIWEAYKRITKGNAAIVLFSQMPFGAELIMSNRKMFRYEWIWEKGGAAGFLNAAKMPLRAHENILVFYSKLPTYNPQKERGGQAVYYMASCKQWNYQLWKEKRRRDNQHRRLTLSA